MKRPYQWPGNTVLRMIMFLIAEIVTYLEIVYHYFISFLSTPENVKSQTFSKKAEPYRYINMYGLSYFLIKQNKTKQKIEKRKGFQHFTTLAFSYIAYDYIWSVWSQGVSRQNQLAQTLPLPHPRCSWACCWKISSSPKSNSYHTPFHTLVQTQYQLKYSLPASKLNSNPSPSTILSSQSNHKPKFNPVPLFPTLSATPSTASNKAPARTVPAATPLTALPATFCF